MHEITFSSSDKSEIYQELLPQIEALIDGEPNFIANLANITAVLKSAFDWLWVGFYLVDKDNLVLGPFQGPPACTRIAHGRGVCGQSWAQAQTIIVPDVNQHLDHIACSSLSQSEIVVPVFNQARQVAAVLDVDAEETNQFDQTDAEFLQKICHLISRQHFSKA
ncbi:GAF domain-containing protein [Neisseria wadsworthii]|uniref:GAF domain-containing protein n=1 Tax=Neisseria wadsworthii TaxID=607711 RepID=UPI000D30A3A9|nr:GAF domain-containing protein [Neisseria wadsworthii]